VKRGRPERGESLQDKSPFLNFWIHILIWETPYESSLSLFVSSLCVLLAPHHFNQRNFVTNLCSSFSIYRRWCIS
jgi:hypothetical protein